MKRLLSCLNVRPISLAVLLTFAGGFIAEAGAQPQPGSRIGIAYACLHKNGDVRFVASADKCGKENETVLGAVMLARLAAHVTSANNANPGDQVPFAGLSTAAVYFSGGGRYCVIPANPGEFNLESGVPGPTAFVRPTVTGDVGLILSNCVAVAGGPAGIHVQITDQNGNPDSSAGFLVEVP